MNTSKREEIEKAEYIANQLGKMKNKKYENYCITRIYHLLNRLDIQFVTQQMLKRGNDRIALADLYLPQLDVWVEVDESHHDKQKELDEKRTNDVIQNKIDHLEEIISVKNRPHRINVVNKSIEEINIQIDKIVDFIKKKINKLGDNFVPWRVTYEKPDYYIKKGCLDEKDKPAFRTIQEVSELFNKGYKGMQRSWFRDKPNSKVTIWCPKLKFDSSDKGKWDNFITPDGEVISESDPRVNKKEYVQGAINLYNKGLTERYVFLKFRDSSGRNMYRFKGVFELDIEKTKEKEKTIWVKKKKSSIDLKQYFS